MRTTSEHYEMSRMALDVEGLTDALVSVRDRVSRLEGVIEGGAMTVARQQRRIRE